MAKVHHRKFIGESLESDGKFTALRKSFPISKHLKSSANILFLGGYSTYPLNDRRRLIFMSSIKYNVMMICYMH